MNNLNSYLPLLVRIFFLCFFNHHKQDNIYNSWKKLYCARSKRNLLIYNYYNFINISRYFLVWKDLTRTRAPARDPGELPLIHHRLSVWIPVPYAVCHIQFLKHVYVCVRNCTHLSQCCLMHTDYKSALKCDKVGHEYTKPKHACRYLLFCVNMSRR